MRARGHTNRGPHADRANHGHDEPRHAAGRLAEIGKKCSVGEETLPTGEVIEEVRARLDAGADRVILESDQVEEAYAGADDGRIAGMVDEIDDEIGTERVVFEIPLTGEPAALDAAAWLINDDGPNVNIGNANLNDTVGQMRRGIGARIPP